MFAPAFDEQFEIIFGDVELLLGLLWGRPRRVTGGWRCPFQEPLMAETLSRGGARPADKGPLLLRHPTPRFKSAVNDVVWCKCVCVSDTYKKLGLRLLVTECQRVLD